MSISPHSLVTLIQEKAQQLFLDYGVSFSQNSVGGIINWLEALDPPCIIQTSPNTRMFARRSFCPSELLLLALEYTKMEEGNQQTSLLQLSDETLKIVARLCLMEVEALDEMLQVVAEAFGLILRRTERGCWISLLGQRSPLPLGVWPAFS